MEYFTVSPHPSKNRYYFIPMLKMREWRLREGKQVAQGHTAKNNQSWNEDLALSSDLVPGNKHPLAQHRLQE